MPVYNGEKYLKPAIDSVLEQSFKDFELVIINDGSTDDSKKIIEGYQDSRIRFLSNDGNRGIAYTRNRGLEVAAGKFLAWMDCDDLIAKNRFEIQLNYLEEHPEIQICGTWMDRFGEEKKETSKSFLKPERIKAMLLFKPAIWNATAMYRLSAIKTAGLKFDTRLTIAEDYDFYCEASFHFPMANIPKSLYSYRASESSIMKSFEGEEEKFLGFHKMIYRKLLIRLQIDPTESELVLHTHLGSTKLYSNFNQYEEGFNWLLFLQSKNKLTLAYDPEAFNFILGHMFFFISKKASQVGLTVWFFYLNHRISFVKPENISSLKLFIRCLIRYKKF